MQALTEIWEDRRFERERNFTRKLALMLQPEAYSVFNKHPDFDEAFERFTRRDSFRGMDIVRIWGLVLNTKLALNKSCGSVAELGVYQGQSASLLSFFAERFGRKIYIADTFSGFAREQYEEGMGESKARAFQDGSLAMAQEIIGSYAGNRWVVGTFPNSITSEMEADRFAFVSIDCDLYQPILEGLKFFWPRMDRGGIIFVHDYGSGHWPGATKAVDEFCAATGISGCLLPDMAGSYVLTA